MSMSDAFKPSQFAHGAGRGKGGSVAGQQEGVVTQSRSSSILKKGASDISSIKTKFEEGVTSKRRSNVCDQNENNKSLSSFVNSDMFSPSSSAGEKQNKKYAEH